MTLRRFDRQFASASMGVGEAVSQSADPVHQAQRSAEDSLDRLFRVLVRREVKRLCRFGV